MYSVKTPPTIDTFLFAVLASDSAVIAPLSLTIQSMERSVYGAMSLT